MRPGKRFLTLGLMGIPLAVVVAGLALVGHFGWQYAKQTIWLNDEKVASYRPVATSGGPAKAAPMWVPLPKPGVKIGTLSFPSLGLSVPVIQGTDTHDLSLGVGHASESALPGQGSNVFLAGHRDTVFRKLKDLKKGETIVFTTTYGDFIYEATGFKVVPETDVTVLAPTDHETLTLSTCYPFDYFGSAPDRYIVFTKLLQAPKLAVGPAQPGGSIGS